MILSYCCINHLHAWYLLSEHDGSTMYSHERTFCHFMTVTVNTHSRVPNLVGVFSHDFHHSSLQRRRVSVPVAHSDDDLRVALDIHPRLLSTPEVKLSCLWSSVPHPLFDCCLCCGTEDTTSRYWLNYSISLLRSSTRIIASKQLLWHYAV